MGTNIDQFREFLEREDLRYAMEEEFEFFALNFGGKTGSFRMIVKIEEGHLLQVFGCGNVKAPEGSRADVALAVARANFGLRLGKFELDLDDGEIRFQVALPLEGDLPSDAVLDRVLHVGVAMLDRYMPAFLSVIYGNESPKNAVALVEQES